VVPLVGVAVVVPLVGVAVAHGSVLEVLELVVEVLELVPVVLALGLDPNSKVRS